ncbi:hypothetical protein Tco_0713260 [Tanacetum coccineum]
MILPPITMKNKLQSNGRQKLEQSTSVSSRESPWLTFINFDDAKEYLTLEIDVKGGSSYNSRVPTASTHSAFISAASTNSKWSTADSKCQPSSVSYTTTSSSADASGNVLENVLHSFVAESDPQQQITYEDFDQIGKLDWKLDIKMPDGNAFSSNQ